MAMLKNGSLASSFGTFATICCTMCGTGILQIPYTLSQGGFASLFMVILVGYMTNWTGKLLVEALYLHPNSNIARIMCYPGLGEAAYGKKGWLCVQWFHKWTLFGVCTIFLIIAAKFLMEAIGGAGEGLFADQFSNNEAFWVKFWTFITAFLVLMPVIAFRSIADLPILSAFGISATVITVLVVIVFSVDLYPITADSDVPGVDNDDDTPFTPPDHKFLDFGLLPSAFSAITLSFGGAANFPSIERTMQKPGDWGKVLDRAFLLLICLYVCVGAIGYNTFGSMTYSPILCNLPLDDSFKGTLVKITKLLVAFHVICSYPILMNTLVTEVEDVMGIKNNLCLRFIERTSFVMATALIAGFMPYFPEFMTLVGASCLTMIVFVLPVVFNWKLKNVRQIKISGGEKVFGCCTILVGLVGGVIGCAQALNDMIEKINTGAVE